MITTLFLDIGGVFLTNGWDHNSRKEASQVFELDLEELNCHHKEIFGELEKGNKTLDEYLNHVVFYEKRPFTKERFLEFMFAQSKPHPDMIELIQNVKKKHGLKTAAVNNECRELNEYRIRSFHLTRFIDFFVSSCYVHLRKPDKKMFEMALDIAQVPAEQVLYIDDREQPVQVAHELGIQSIHHTDIQSTKEKLFTSIN